MPMWCHSTTVVARIGDQTVFNVLITQSKRKRQIVSTKFHSFELWRVKLYDMWTEGVDYVAVGPIVEYAYTYLATNQCMEFFFFNKDGIKNNMA